MFIETKFEYEMVERLVFALEEIARAMNRKQDACTERPEDNAEGRKLWIDKVLSPALALMPRCNIESLEYVDRGDDKQGQVIVVTYDNGYSREVNVTADSSKACLYDLVYSHTLE